MFCPKKTVTQYGGFVILQLSVIDPQDGQATYFLISARCFMDMMVLEQLKNPNGENILFFLGLRHSMKKTGYGKKTLKENTKNFLY